MTDKPVKIGSISAQILALMLTDEHYRDRLELLMDLSAALNNEYHALADAGAPIVQIEEPAIHQVITDPNAPIKPAQWVEAFNARSRVCATNAKCGATPAGARRPRNASPARTSRTRRRCLVSISSTAMCSRSRAPSNSGMDLEHFGTMISKDKKIALGVISHRTLQVERPEEVADLIRRALKHIEPERLILTSDCGFGRQAMSRMHAFYKMVALMRGTNIVRKELGTARKPTFRQPIRNCRWCRSRENERHG